MEHDRLPDFVIAGAMKCGTTSLAKWLGEHPQAFVAPEKEVAFFTAHWERGPEWYRSRFAGSDGALAVGDATPTYLFDATARERMVETLPDARYVLCVRDPAERAFSHWLHWWRKGERRSFEAVVEHELAQPRRSCGSTWVSSEPEAYSYLGQGRYAAQLEWLCERVPRSSVHVVVMEDLERDPVATFQGVCRYLGIDDTRVPEVVGSRENTYIHVRAPHVYDLLLAIRFGEWAPKPLGRAVARRMFRPGAERPAMSPAVRARLVEHFEPDTAALEAWLGRGLPEWRAVAPGPGPGDGPSAGGRFARAERAPAAGRTA